MKRTLITTLLIGVLSQIGLTQHFDAAKLDDFFDVLESNDRFMGSVAVSRDGEIIYSRTLGYADIENSVKANENSKYRIGSISKTFTSAMVLTAVEDKKLDLDQTIEKYFPNIENAEKITIKHLLSHRSGIHSFTDNKDYLAWHTEPRTEKEMVEIIVKGGSVFEPGSRAAYSNSNFVLLTYILERTFNKSYADLLQEYIIKPVGLANTSMGGKINPARNECKSYTFLGSWKVEPETDMSIPLGAGGIISTPGDIVKFSDALFGEKLLTPESLEKIKTIEDHYGMGLFPIPFYDKAGYGHTGGIDGFSSVFSYFPDGNISYALVSNGTNFNNNDISLAVLRAVYNKDFDIPEFSSYHITSEELDKYLGVYSSKEIPLKITITKDNNVLIAQATGQPAFPLEASGKDIFRFDQAGVVLEFNPTDNTMILKQHGGQFIFTKE